MTLLDLYRMVANDLSLHSIPFFLEKEQFKINIGKRNFTITVIPDGTSLKAAYSVIEDSGKIIYEGNLRILFIKKLVDIKREYALVEYQKKEEDVDIAAFVRKKRKPRKKKAVSDKPSSLTTPDSMPPNATLDPTECPVSVTRRRFEDRSRVR
jgi:hypothetical protein